MANLHAEIVTDRSTEHRLSSRNAIARAQGWNIGGQVEVNRSPKDDAISVEFWLTGGSHSSIDAQKIATVELTAQHEIKATLGAAMLTACAVTDNDGKLVGVWNNGYRALRELVQRGVIAKSHLDGAEAIGTETLLHNTGENIIGGYHFRPIQLNS